jgi:hypothetical protein
MVINVAHNKRKIHPISPNGMGVSHSLSEGIKIYPMPDSDEVKIDFPVPAAYGGVQVNRLEDNAGIEVYSVSPEQELWEVPGGRFWKSKCAKRYKLITESGSFRIGLGGVRPNAENRARQFQPTVEDASDDDGDYFRDGHCTFQGSPPYAPHDSRTYARNDEEQARWEQEQQDRNAKEVQERKNQETWDRKYGEGRRLKEDSERKHKEEEEGRKREQEQQDETDRKPQGNICQNAENKDEQAPDGNGTQETKTDNGQGSGDKSIQDPGYSNEQQPETKNGQQQLDSSSDQQPETKNDQQPDSNNDQALQSNQDQEAAPIDEAGKRPPWWRYEIHGFEDEL